MQHSQLLQAVRRAVHEAFAEQNGDDVDVIESILLRDSAYCGRRFAAGGRQAIWFVEENQVKFYSASGSVTDVLSASELIHGGQREMRRAA